VQAGGRRKGKGRSRILYWFRTPPGVRVGRAALDEEAIRLIEEYNPELEFDWTRILKEQGAETRAAPQKDRDRDFRAERVARRQARAIERSEAAAATNPGTPASQQSPDVELPAVDLDDVAAEAPAKSDQLEVPVPSDDSVVSEDLVYSDDSIYAEASEGPPPRPSHARLGSEGLARLRARYAEVLARITERVPDPARQDELKAQAERLNPDSWVTDPEVTAGLEAYESVFEALRSAVGAPGRRRRRRRRKDGGPTAPAPAEESGQLPAGEPEAPDPAGEDPDENL
jgi:hypothetical protein